MIGRVSPPTQGAAVAALPPQSHQRVFSVRSLSGEEGTQKTTVIGDVMTKQLVTVEPPTSLAAAVTVMGMHPVGAVLVMGLGRLEGIFTERDLVRAMSYDRRFYDIEASSQPVSHWMTRNPVTVGPEASVEQALEIMRAKHFRHLPVMEGESLVGVVSMSDLLV